MNIAELMEMGGENAAIVNGFAKAHSVLQRYRRPVCSISGGADSDIILDMCTRLDEERKITYVWFNTGLEYQATKKHLSYLEGKYKIEIMRVPASRSVAECCKEYGQPFLSRLVSRNIASLQRHNFKWKDEPFEVLYHEAPQTYIRWWCNRSKFRDSVWNVDRIKYLKDFLIAYPPRFKISDKCCYYAKKKVAREIYRTLDADLSIIGVRKAEGGIRSITSTCFTPSETGPHIFRPVFWFKDEDKARYNEIFKIKNSDCYSVYGLKRTGCVGCPFNRNLLKELDVIKKFEPGLFRAVSNVFKDTYEYTRLFRQFVACQKGAKV